MVAQRRAEVVVVGGGAMGVATAWQLGALGVDAVLIEQYRIGHERGSSRGPTRVFRHAYADQTYVRLMQIALPVWGELEAECGQTLMRRTGAFDIGPHTQACADAMAAEGIPHEWLDSEAARGLTELVATRAGEQVLFHQDAGVCFSERMLAACASLATRAGVDVREGTRVERIVVSSDGVAVATSEGVVAADRAVVAVGAWASPLLAEAGINVAVAPSSTHVAYFRARPDQSDDVPVVIEHHADCPGSYSYVVPSATPGSGIKVGRFWKEQAHNDPDERSLEVDMDVVDLHSGYVASRLPTFDPVPAYSEVCLYEMTPTEDFVVGREGSVVVGVGFSGHGFKFAPLVGQMLARLAVGEEVALPPTFGLDAHGHRHQLDPI